MLNFDVKRKINTLRDILVGKVPDPKAQVEQITIALIYKFMDDMDIDSVNFGGNREFFKGEYEKYAFSQLMVPEHSAQKRLNLYAEGIEKITMNPDLPQLFRDIFRGAYIPYRDPETLNMFLKEIAEFSYSNSEDLGNAFEYLLSIMGSQGDAGQFRTPRHIIDMMVDITAPQKNESILDPACGTAAGFLISAFKYIEAHNRDKSGTSTLTADDKNRMVANFAGYDISPDMVRLSRVNMYLHGFSKPPISEYDTLTSLDKWDDNYDVIFANPPFMTPKGGIIPHNRYRNTARRSEVLFVDYIAEHLTPTGRAAVIVPEGIVFQSANAYKNLRKFLVDDGLLYAVISLPAGVFNPYSGVKTSILLMDKTLAKVRDSILFVKLNNDGFDLGAQRREVKGNEIPDVISVVQDYQNGVDVEGRLNTILAKKADIAKQDNILIGERYRPTVIVDTKWPMVKLGEVCELLVGGTPSKQKEQFWTNGCIKWISSKYISGDGQIIDNDLITNLAVKESSTKIAPKNSTILVTRVSVGKSAFADDNYAINQDMTCLIPNAQLNYRYLFIITRNLTKKIENDAQGIGVKGVTQKYVANLIIPLPPLPVQEEIVEEIEGYQKVINGAKQIVDNYKPNIKIDPAWDMVRLADICDIITKGTTPTTNGFNFQETGVNFIKIEAISENGSIDMDKVAHISNNCHQALSRSQLRENDILFSIAGTKMGISSIVPAYILPANTNQALSIIRLKDGIDALYVLLYLKSPALINIIEKDKVGVAQFNLSLKQIGNLHIPLPPIEIQHEIVARISEEMAIMEQNKRLIEIFQQKIRDKIADVWGE